MSSKLPKAVLVRCELIGTISERAVLLYSLLCDLMQLSKQNKDFHDDSGEPFVLYPVERVAAVFRIGQTQARQTFKELESAGLIKRVQQGCGKPSRIYIPEVTDGKPTVKTDGKPTVKTDGKPTVKTDGKPTVKTDGKPTPSHQKKSNNISQGRKSSSGGETHENLPNQLSFDDFFAEMMTESDAAKITAQIIVENQQEFAEITPEIADFVAKNVENALKKSKIANIRGYVRAALRRGKSDFESRSPEPSTDETGYKATYDISEYERYGIFDKYFYFDKLPSDLEPIREKLMYGHRLYVKDLTAAERARVEMLADSPARCEDDMLR